MEVFWKAAVACAGIGGVGAFVFWSLFYGWLKLPIFQRLTRKQLFTLFLVFLSLTFLFGVAALATYACVSTSVRKHGADSNTELILLLKERERLVLDMIETQEQTIAHARDKLYPQDSITRLRAFKERFLRLSSANLDALRNNNFILAHEITREIRDLFCSDEVLDLFTVWKPVYGISGDTTEIGEHRRGLPAPKFVAERWIDFIWAYFRPFRIFAANTRSEQFRACFVLPDPNPLAVAPASPPPNSHVRYRWPDERGKPLESEKEQGMGKRDTH